MTALNRSDFKALAFLRRGAFVRRGGEWRFGTARVGDTVVERLIEAGRASQLFSGTPAECVILRDRT